MSTSWRELAIRRADTKGDWQEIRRICCETGNGGDPIIPERWPFFAEHWIGPYETLCPDSAYVAVDPASDAVAGYLTGCRNTSDFARRKPLGFDLPLLTRLLLRRYPWSSDTRRFRRRALRLEKGPEQSFPVETLKRLHQEYPAHLHTNVRAAYRSRGTGAQLLAAFRADLRAQSVPGIHLFCGEKPLPFYARNGFQEVARLEFRPGVWVYALGLKL